MLHVLLQSDYQLAEINVQCTYILDELFLSDVVVFRMTRKITTDCLLSSNEWYSVTVLTKRCCEWTINVIVKAHTLFNAKNVDGRFCLLLSICFRMKFSNNKTIISTRHTDANETEQKNRNGIKHSRYNGT